MPSPSAAEEHLRVIRSLMEKATIYRAISAQAALFAGTLACAVGLFAQMKQAAPDSDQIFVIRWFCVLGLGAAANFYFLHRDARLRGETFASAGMRMALRAMAPPLVCGGCLSFLASETVTAALWILFYGLALLSTGHFAPRSLERLGYAFVAAGLAAVFLQKGGVFDNMSGAADLLMAVCFGLFHLVYAAFAWPRSQPQSALTTSS
jgi:hypothetical protein